MTESPDHANGAQLLEMMQSLTNQMTAMNTASEQRFSALENRATVSVVPVQSVSGDSTISQSTIAPITRPPSILEEDSHAKAASLNMIRSLDRDMPLLTDDNYTEWVDHAIAYCDSAGWGKEDIPEVFTDDNHPYSKEARKFFWNKTSSEWKVRIKLAELHTAKALWDWLKSSACETAKSNRFLNLDALLSVKARDDESVTKFSVRAMELRQKVALGGGTVDDETVLTSILRGLPDRLHAAKDDVTNRNMSLSTAIIYLQRAETSANTYGVGRNDHSALVAYDKTQASTSEWRSANRPADWVVPSTNLKCLRCGKTGHVASICEEPRPVASAYAAFLAYKPMRKPMFAKSAKPITGIYHSTFLSIYITWIVDSGATSHMTPNKLCFHTYQDFPLWPQTSTARVVY